MRHQGPDRTGWHDEDGIVLGMCRLAVVGLVGGDQPVFDEAGTRVVVCNGEIYNHIELPSLAPGMSSRPRPTQPSSRTCTTTWTGSCVACGMFALALWDRRARRLVLARDRLGKKPLYWTRTSGGGVAFASEIPALRAIVGPAAIDRRDRPAPLPGIGHDPGSARTIYRSVSAIPVAARLDLEQIEVRPPCTRGLAP